VSTTLVAPARPGDRVPVSTPWRWTAAGAVGLAGGLHAVAAVQHAGEAPTLAAGFVATALVQLGTAGWLALGARGSGWGTRTVVLALGSTVAFLLVLLVAHTTTWLPVLHDGAAGAHGGHGGHSTATGPVALGLDAPAEVEPLGVLGTATGLAEVVAVLGLVALLPPRARSRTTTGLLVLGLATWAAWLTGLLG
jgi:hypothetical protein